VIETILNGLLPVVVAIILGWLSARIGLLKHEDAGVLATLVIRFALPFALFYAAVTTPADKVVDPGLALCLTFGLTGSYLIALALGCLVFKHDLRTATMQALECGYPDMAFWCSNPRSHVRSTRVPGCARRQPGHQYPHVAPDHCFDAPVGQAGSGARLEGRRTRPSFSTTTFRFPSDSIGSGYGLLLKCAGLGAFGA
jgi:hypothetical protein